MPTEVACGRWRTWERILCSCKLPTTKNGPASQMWYLQVLHPCPLPDGQQFTYIGRRRIQSSLLFSSVQKIVINVETSISFNLDGNWSIGFKVLLQSLRILFWLIVCDATWWDAVLQVERWDRIMPVIRNPIWVGRVETYNRQTWV
jgi:hypothetical protein